MTAPVRIAIADDQALVRRGLSALLADLGLHIALEADDGAALLAGVAKRPVDVILSDIRMPGMDGIALVRALRERRDATPVILLTTFDDSALMLAAVDAGAQGFLLKDASPEDLREAILRVAAGETLLQPVSLGPVRAAWPDRDAGPADPHLTERERSILRLVAGGYSNKEIGRSLHLSEGTVKNYISDILLKLDCRDRTHAVLKAITRRLL
ncbi:response regulator [Vulcaniibacterium thermophilum]|jgi:DNA-binding NarL/FixJ family response regulator|uniref:DNA-binding response regulator n=1 Tax=Vulcaniibacterium thermophilum TaxID=1169913 RepID=A0A918YVE4_9GAMM|nr:response regulator transcription factor [Vulcaniibacterium thermophilum]GHE25797.1 DNA-binding response regulator [Vulcaniibacterium thermophilum]